MKVTVEVPDECIGRKACVFNLGLHGYCLCYEHYEITHGRDREVIENYFTKHPERRGQVKVFYGAKL